MLIGDIPERPALDAAVENMAELVRPALSEPAEIYRSGPMWFDDGWGLVIKLETDRQLESLLQRDDIRTKIETIAANLNCDEENPCEFYGAFIHTQEYVDREYGGNWFGAHHNGGKPWKLRAPKG